MRLTARTHLLSLLHALAGDPLRRLLRGGGRAHVHRSASGPLLAPLRPHAPEALLRVLLRVLLLLLLLLSPPPR